MLAAGLLGYNKSEILNRNIKVNKRIKKFYLNLKLKELFFVLIFNLNSSIILNLNLKNTF
jgi:hypothetical protein